MVKALAFQSESASSIPSWGIYFFLMIHINYKVVRSQMDVAIRRNSAQFREKIIKVLFTDGRRNSAQFREKIIKASL